MIPVLSVSLALLLDLFLGDPPNRYHPVVAMGAFIRWASRRAPQGGPAVRFWYGAGFMLAGILLFSLPWVGLQFWLAPYPVALTLVNAVLLKPVFALRRLIEAGREVQLYLESGDLKTARRTLAWHLVSRETRTLDEGHVASAVIESLSENLTDSLIAPLLAFLLGGLPLAWAYRFVNTADAMIGYHTPEYEYLGKFAARLDDVFNWLPARLGALALVVGAGSVGGNVRQTWQVLAAQSGRTASPNAGWTMSAAAGALGLKLEKIGHYVFDGGPELPLPVDIDRSVRLVGTAAGIWLVSTFLVLLGIVYVF